jgi:hypothetical protein
VPRSALIALAIGALAGNEALACTPIAYDMTGVDAPSFATQMVEDASSIQLMRVVSRREADMTRIREHTGDYYDQLYLYEFVPITTLRGPRLGAMSLHGLDSNWRAARVGAEPRPPTPPLFWTTPLGYEILQNTVIPDPANPDGLACAFEATFDVGATYLVFREASGALLSPGFESRGFANTGNRPSIERVAGPTDRWLQQVQTTIEERPAGADFWKAVFDILFGGRSNRG